MNLNRTLNALASAALLTLAGAGAANAAITVSIYHTDPGAAAAAANATLGQAGSLVADGTTTVSAINFTDAPGNDSTNFTVGAFLNNPAGLSPTVAGLTLNNTYFYFSGSTYLQAGANSFVVPHDDGLQLNISGIGLVVDQPGPTAPVNTPFTVNAPTAGFYNFQLSYGETAGGPAVLAFLVNGGPAGVPEPASWAMMTLGVAGVGGMMRRRSSKATVAA